MNGLIGQGQEVEWRARHFGFWVNMRSRITAFEPPHYFQDGMVHGPFRHFVHDHWFDGQGTVTLMRDVLRFSSPVPLLASALDPLVLGPHLRKFLALRNHALKAAAESDAWQKYLPAESRYN